MDRVSNLVLIDFLAYLVRNRTQVYLPDYFHKHEPDDEFEGHFIPASDRVRWKRKVSTGLLYAMFNDWLGGKMPAVQSAYTKQTFVSGFVSLEDEFKVVRMTIGGKRVKAVQFSS